jgi:hypothetical protein
MSRSYRKPYIKDGGHDRKQIHARAMRRRVHQILWEHCKTMPPEWRWWFFLGKEYDDPVFKTPEQPDLPHSYQITNPYDICDWSCYVPEEARYYRK